MSATTLPEEFLRTAPRQSPATEQSTGIVLRCPACGTVKSESAQQPSAAGTGPVVCRNCSFYMTQNRGVWQALPAERHKHFEQFMLEYEQVRKAEGRGSASSEFYLALPFRDLTRHNSWQWSIRTRTHLYIVRNILPTLRRKNNESLKILDLGAGNGWLSYRLAALGHSPTAVDLLTNEFDGLGAAHHYASAIPSLFPRFQAELDNLPFASDQFDCAIFNAAFHYSENYERTLSETMRCLRPGGTIIIADSPTYSGESVGRQMVVERQEMFRRSFGFASDSLNSSEFLTPQRLLELAAKLRLEWKTHKIWYGLRWASRPLLSRLKRRREPAEFLVYTGQVKR